MSRRFLFVLTGPVLIALSLGLACHQRAGGLPDPPRNIVLISVDTLRADHLSCYGYERTTSPRLDGYAAGGTLFDNVTAASSWTVPSHMSIFTGVEAIAHGLIDYPDAGRLGRGYTTLPELFRKADFRTAAFTGGGFMSARHGFDIGFDEFVTHGRRFEDNMTAVDAWLDGVRPDERFFLFLHGFNVHKPYKPPSPYDTRFADGYAGDYDTISFQPENPHPSKEDLEFVVSQYDGEIAYVDELLGNFFERLAERGLLDDTLVVVTSDHGDEMYEHGNVDHIHTLYDELIQVPLIMFGPGIPRRVVSDHFAQMDLYPTLCELMGVPHEPPTQAANRAVMLSPGHEEARPTDDYGNPVYSFTGFSAYPYDISSVRTNRWKLKVWSLAGMKDAALPEDRDRYTYKFRPETEDFVELFDLRNDPGEQVNLAGNHADVAQRLAEMLQDRTKASLAFAHPPENAAEPKRDYIDALKALGYLQDDTDS